MVMLLVSVVMMPLKGTALAFYFMMCQYVLDLEVQ
jgi:hypothetical protein